MQRVKNDCHLTDEFGSEKLENRLKCGTKFWMIPYNIIESFACTEKPMMWSA